MVPHFDGGGMPAGGSARGTAWRESIPPLPACLPACLFYLPSSHQQPPTRHPSARQAWAACRQASLSCAGTLVGHCRAALVQKAAAAAALPLRCQLVLSSILSLLLLCSCLCLVLGLVADVQPPWALLLSPPDQAKVIPSASPALCLRLALDAPLDAPNSLASLADVPWVQAKG